MKPSIILKNTFNVLPFISFCLLFSFFLSCNKEEELETEVTCNDEVVVESFDHQVTFNYEYDISGMNDTLFDNFHTVDIVLYHSDQQSMSWANFQTEFNTADDAFRSVGVQLNLKKAVNVTFPTDWNNQICMNLNALPDSGQSPGFYDLYNTTQPTILPLMEDIFIDFTHGEINKEKTIFIIPLSGLKIVFAQKNTDETWQVSNQVPTGGYSFPAYLFHDRIPKPLRGVINIEQSSGVTLAHELGHKLINVSHEGLAASPAFTGSSIPGLMGYGNATDIYGGQTGRWHQERLLLSPFLYKLNNGTKTYNQDYAINGAYDDPIYGSYVMPQ